VRQRRIIAIGLGPGLVLELALAGRAAHADNVTALLDRVEAAARGVETLSGEFQQKNHVKLFKQDLTSKGRFAFQRPRRVRWEYLSPDPSVMVLDGDRATLRAPGAEAQVFELGRDPTMRAMFDQLLLWLGAGDLKASRADYAMSVAGGADAPSLVLVPREGAAVAKVMARIELRFDARATLAAIALREAGGDEKEITFSHLERNKPLPADTFR
jgi:outer membrane lipoprotein-sorting protein